MSQKNLSVYLNDHSAGSVGAIRLFDRLRRRVDEPDFESELTRVRDEVQADRRVLHDLRETLGIRRSRLREAAAWVGEKLAVLKLRLERSKHGELQILHALDALTLGIEGKKALWTALAEAQEVNPRLRLADYAALIRRADEQIASLRGLRLRTARRAFSPGDGQGSKPPV